jgi:hypothetical protein
MKIRPVGAGLFHVNGKTEDGHTDMVKLVVAFSKFANAPTKKSVTVKAKLVHRMCETISQPL